jgi:hypothetical protein
MIVKTPAVKQIKKKNAQQPQQAYKNSKLLVAARVTDLIKRMTLEEKVAQMLCIWGQKNTELFDAYGNLNTWPLRILIKNIQLSPGILKSWSVTLPATRTW